MSALEIVSLVAGMVIVLAGVADLAWTTLAASGGGGPLTSRLAHYLWELIRIRKKVSRRHQIMRLGGLAIVGVTIALWVAMPWIGWTLVFSSSETAVVSAASGEPAGWWARLYFAGTTLSTLGPGDVVADGAAWRVLTVVASMNGLLMATLAITYFIPVVGSVTNRRQVAAQVAALGRDPYGIVARATRRGTRDDLARHLQELGAAIQRLAQQHLTYPSLHYFHDVNRETAGPVQIAVLDEALTVLSVASDHTEPITTTVDATRAAIETFLATLAAAYIAPADEPPPGPDPHRVDALGLDIDHTALRERLDELTDRRRALLAFVEDDGWDWSEVYPPSGEEDDEDETHRGSVTEGPELE